VKSSLIRGASPLGLPYTHSRAPLRRRAPFAWLARALARCASQPVSQITSRLVALGAAALAGWGLKQHYAGARPDDLLWILSPTASLVGFVSGATFVFQPGEGYLSREHLFLIEKSCAGINFMIAAFGMLVCSLFHRAGSGLTAAAQVLSASLLASYATAVIVNTVRVAIAMWLAAHPVSLWTLGAADVHRLEGIAVYFGGLVLLHELVRVFDPTAAGRAFQALGVGRAFQARRAVR
jgi:exosortase K